MGELIKNLHPITLGKEELMVELNEGGSKKTGKIIHIQNKDFRLELWEKDFLRLSATILRAKSELDHLKQKEKNRQYPLIMGGAAEADQHTMQLTGEFCAELAKAGIAYRIVDKTKELVTIIVNPGNRELFMKTAKKISGVKRKPHPSGILFGYKFLYKMKPFLMYEMKGLYIQVFFQLPCYSLTPKTWIPLDRAIQARVWSEENVRDGLCVLDDVSAYIYRLCLAVFKKRGFNDRDVCYFESYAAVTEEAVFTELMKKVFFSYSEKLIQDMKDRKYDTLLAGYYGYCE
ncbi:MAG: hypothetical protein K5686_07810 [Lachnospiraceae bacterium]|nr:hypothetical protein [Lachnospiraceae bacterium]